MYPSSKCVRNPASTISILISRLTLCHYHLVFIMQSQKIVHFELKDCIFKSLLFPLPRKFTKPLSDSSLLILPSYCAIANSNISVFNTLLIPTTDSRDIVMLYYKH